jgi:hypothetical protein
MLVPLPLPDRNISLAPASRGARGLDQSIYDEIGPALPLTIPCVRPSVSASYTGPGSAANSFAGIVDKAASPVREGVAIGDRVAPSGGCQRSAAVTDANSSALNSYGSTRGAGSRQV